MKPLPVWPLLCTFAIVLIAVILSMAIDHAVFAGWYTVWKDNQTFVAAMIALAAAIWAAWPVYRQMRIQNAQGAVALIPLVENDIVEEEKHFDLLVRTIDLLQGLGQCLQKYETNIEHASAVITPEMIQFVDADPEDRVDWQKRHDLDETRISRLTSIAFYFNEIHMGVRKFMDGNGFAVDPNDVRAFARDSSTTRQYLIATLRIERAVTVTAIRDLRERGATLRRAMRAIN